MTTINQKEYLKKYLAIGKAPGEKKKKKKKEKIEANRLKIIDDDVDVLMSKEIEDDISTANEYAPQIVAVIDERPHSLQVDEKTNSNLWQPIGGPSRLDSDIHTVKLNSFKLGKQVKHTDIKKSVLKVTKESVTEIHNKNTSHDKKDNSTVIKVRQENYIDRYSKKSVRERSNSPLRKHKDDVSPPRKTYQEENYSPPRRNEDDDYSPPRKSVKDDSLTSRKKDNDYSPPRKKLTQDSSSKKTRDDISTSYNRNREYDDSPPRTRIVDDSSSPRRKNDDDNSPLRKRIKEDNSPPRRKNNEDSSPTRRRKYDKRVEDDYSPQRKRFKEDRTRKEMEFSPRNRHKSDFSPTVVRVKSEDGDISSSRKDKRKKKSRWSKEESPESFLGDKMKKTLDGKRAGLQNAKDLSKESKYLRQKEDEIFNKMSADISGRNAATVVRSKKAKDQEEEAARAKREQEMKEKYDRWGKGLKQVEDQNQKIEEQLHEMSKPLARYADDEDLEKFLKEQEREGDPMLNYIRKKKRKDKVAAGIPEKPMYMGEFMPNRFGIRPGYRWDGVDRSNGYEKKWFQVQNAKKADREEAFKWSTEDM
ncbi:BUD13 homolog [Anoplophora glabripennis]|uniref:BUD13 homolog n=1 Tax=Anoplophora glabripennis TaxID=217634 RepID=UPI000874D6E1|nr:BUD13 homolog [Anoplophora glabripennis]